MKSEQGCVTVVMHEWLFSAFSAPASPEGRGGGMRSGPSAQGNQGKRNV